MSCLSPILFEEVTLMWEEGSFFPEPSLKKTKSTARGGSVSIKGACKPVGKVFAGSFPPLTYGYDDWNPPISIICLYVRLSGSALKSPIRNTISSSLFSLSFIQHTAPYIWCNLIWSSGIGWWRCVLYTWTLRPLFSINSSRIILRYGLNCSTSLSITLPNLSSASLSTSIALPSNAAMGSGQFRCMNMGSYTAASNAVYPSARLDAPNSSSLMLCLFVCLERFSYFWVGSTNSLSCFDPNTTSCKDIISAFNS